MRSVASFGVSLLVLAGAACGSSHSSASGADGATDGASGRSTDGATGRSSDGATGRSSDGATGRSSDGATDGTTDGGVSSAGDSGGKRDSGKPPHRDGGVPPVDAWVAPDVGAPVEAGSPGTVSITLTVNASQGVQPISPYVYGVNEAAEVAAVHSPMVRLGGNRFTAFNWENNASNAGSDYDFENDNYLCGLVTCPGGNDAPGAYLLAILDEAKAAGAGALVTVPIVDYVAADKSPPGDVRDSGANYLQTRFKENKAVKGSAFSFPPDTTDDSVYQDEMAHWLATEGEPGVTLRFLLDNEPDLWSSTHAEVHPVPVTYAELAQRNIEFAAAVKNAVPGAYVAGPVSYGWEGYVSLQSATDSAADGDFITWWLQQMKAAEAQAGVRLIDDLDLHWYPEATGGGVRITGAGTSPAEVAAREQAPRSLWDATYTETSWITQDSTNGPIDLIPREMQKIADNYPGTRLSFSEWYYGGGTDISGAIATADVLGIFGAYGVDMAMLWPSGSGDGYTYAAFQAYRDYDGNGAAFGDTSVSASTSDVPDSSVYASVDSADPSRLVLVAINKATADEVTGIVIQHSTVYKTATVYTVTVGGGENVVPAAPLTAVATNAFQYTMPAQSVSVIVPSP